MRRRTILIAFMAVLATVAACQPKARKRVFTYHRLGPVANFAAPETFLPQHQLLLRLDKGGFSVMSTACTVDLTALEPVTLPSGERIFQSRETTASYHFDGQVRSAPAVAPLPYFRLELKPGTIGGPPDTLFARIGDEVPNSWRLPMQIRE